MTRFRPEQALLTRDNNLSKTEETRRVVASMVDALNDHDISGMGRVFTETFRWLGNAGGGRGPPRGARQRGRCIEAPGHRRQGTVLYRDLPLDGQCRMRHQEQPEGVSGQL